MFLKAHSRVCIDGQFGFGFLSKQNIIIIINNYNMTGTDD
jgi:hypothetical protein